MQSHGRDQAAEASCSCSDSLPSIPNTATPALTEAVRELHNEISESVKRQRLELAILNTSKGNFKYYSSKSPSALDSRNLLQSVFIEFRKSKGVNVNGLSLEPYDGMQVSEYYRKREEMFVTMISGQIEALTGIKPRVDAGVIYYS